MVLAREAVDLSELVATVVARERAAALSFGCTIAVEHTDDIVPALGGTIAAGAGPLYVRRELFADAPVPTDTPLPAHRLAGYRETARLLDGSAEPRLLAFREQLVGIAGSATGEQSVWRAERIEPAG